MAHSLVRLLFLIPRLLAWKASFPSFSMYDFSLTSTPPGTLSFPGWGSTLRYPWPQTLSPWVAVIYLRCLSVSFCGQGCCVCHIGISSSCHCTWHRAGPQLCLLNFMKLWSSCEKYHDIQNKTLALKVRQH